MGPLSKTHQNKIITQLFYGYRTQKISPSGAHVMQWSHCSTSRGKGRLHFCKNRIWCAVIPRYTFFFRSSRKHMPHEFSPCTPQFSQESHQKSQFYRRNKMKTNSKSHFPELQIIALCHWQLVIDLNGHGNEKVEGNLKRNTNTDLLGKQITL